MGGGGSCGLHTKKVLYKGMELITGGQGVMDHTPQSQTCIIKCP